MATNVLPIDASEAAYTVQANLGGTVYGFAVAWNTRAEAWEIGITTAGGDPIVMGQRIVPDYQLFRPFNDPRLPAGRILCLDLTGTGAYPTRTNLGSDCVVAYDDGN